MGKVTNRISSVCGLAVVSGGLLGLTGLAGMSLATPEASAESANASVNVTEACAMTSTGNTTHTAEVDNGRYVDNIGTTSFNVTCNDAGGFSVYAVGFTGDEIGGTNSTKLVGSANAGLISTGTATSGENSAWAMKLATSATAIYPVSILGGYDSYSSVPASYTKVATRTGTTDTGNGATGASFTTTYAAYVNSGQTADTYNGKVKYTLVHPANEMPLQPQIATSGCINYFANTSSAEGTMGCQSISTSATSATLLASNFSRTGYGFAGWSDKYDYVTNSSAKFYGPQETITFTAGQYTGSNNGLALYAVWVKSEGSLQDATKVAELCGTGSNALTTAPTDGTANLDSVSALTDSRDNQTYAIAKLADGKCWMIENLRLDNTASLTFSNTNNPLNDGTNVTLKHSYSDTETHNTLSASQDPTATAWCASNAASCDDQSMLFTGNTTNRTSSPTANGVAMYSYGNYYNWYSATAGRGTYSFSTNNNSVAGDLCPAGWRLPQGGNKTRIESNDDNDFWNLTVDALNGGVTPANYSGTTTPYYNVAEAGRVDKKLRSYPNNFVYSGSVNGDSVVGRGSYGYFWSSTAYSSVNAYNLRLNSSYVYPGTIDDFRYYGRTVRCVVSGV